MGSFATGVTVVTTRVGNETSAMTANAVLSLSLDPPLLLVSVQKESQMHQLLMRSNCFAINILSSGQAHLSERFAQPGPKDLSDLVTQKVVTGAPVLVDVLAFVDCQLRQVIAGGEHDMFIGEPMEGDLGEGGPLLFYAGGYGDLTIRRCE